MTTRQEKIQLLLLLGLVFLSRMYHINTPPWELEESWRQADTLAMAWNFAQVQFHPLMPQLNYDGPFPNVPALEIQVTTSLIALLYKLFGHQVFLSRLVPILFFVLSAAFLYGFARVHTSVRGGQFILILFAILPLTFYYSRAIMPESAALLFSNGGIYGFQRWLMMEREKPVEGGRRWGLLFFSGLFMALAVMTKPPVLFIGLPMVFLGIRFLGWKVLKSPVLWLYGLVVLLLPAVYFQVSAGLAEYQFTTGIGRDLVLKNCLKAFYSPEGLIFYQTQLPRTLGWLVLFLLPAALVQIGRGQRVFQVWFMAMVLEVLLVVSTIRAPYYLIFATVPLSLVLGQYLGQVWERGGKVLALMLLILIGGESLDRLRPMYTINETMKEQVLITRQLTQPEDLLVLGSFDPCLLSLGDRRGWRYQLGLYSDVPKDPYEELNHYIAQGAKYFVPIQGQIYGDQDGKWRAYLEEHYLKIEPVQGFPFFDLQQPL